MPRLKGIERIRNQFDVVRVRCCDDQRQRKPPGVRQQAALYTLFPFVRKRRLSTVWSRIQDPVT